VQIVIVGGGTVGFDLAAQLRKAGHDVGLVERDPARSTELQDKLDALVVEGAGSSPLALEQAGLRGADMVLAVTSSDEVNILVCGLAEQWDVATRIARVRNPEFTSRRSRVDLHRLGVTRVIDPERILVRVIDQIARIPDVVEAFGYHDGDVLIVRHIMTERMPVVGHPLSELSKRTAGERLLAVALQRGSETRIPSGKDILQPGDDVTTVFASRSLPRYLEMLALTGRQVHKAIVFGDGLAALRLCEVFSAWVDDLTLIDPDAAHGRLAAERLDKAEVIHGDATNRDVLREVQVSGAGLFVGAARITADNVMSALLARSEGAARVIVVSDEPSNNRLFRHLGIDHVVTPRRLMAQEIMDVIHRGRRSLELQLRDMPLESVLMRADPGSPVTRGPLAETWAALRGRAIVGAVVHEGETVIPGGETRIAPGDDAVIVTEPGEVKKVQKIFGGA